MLFRLGGKSFCWVFSEREGGKLGREEFSIAVEVSFLFWKATGERNGNGDKNRGERVVHVKRRRRSVDS